MVKIFRILWPFLAFCAFFVKPIESHGLSLLQKQFYGERDQSTASSINFSTSRPPPPSLLASLTSSLPREVCSKLQHEVQKAVILHKWGLDNLKFQQRLKRHPKYIVTIQVIRAQHEPIVELKCSAPTSTSTTSNGNYYSNLDGNSNINSKEGPRLEFNFHETRFMADSVRLFDIHSIFPIHTGSMSVKMKLDPLVITLDPINVVGDRLRISDLTSDKNPQNSGQILNINKIYFEKPTNGDFATKEHREETQGIGTSDDLVDLEKEIETVFLNRIQPDVQNQLKNIISTTVKNYLAKNYIRF